MYGIVWDTKCVLIYCAACVKCVWTRLKSFLKTCHYKKLIYGTFKLW